MNKKWKEKTILEKVASIVSGVALCVWLVFGVLERTTSLQFAKYVNCAAVCVICVCEAISFWKVKRCISYISIGGTIFMIAILILEMLLIA